MLKVSDAQGKGQVCAITMYLDNVNVSDDGKRASIQLGQIELYELITQLKTVIKKHLQIEKTPARVVSKATKAYSDNS